MVPEAALEKTEAGLAAVRRGWFVLNASEARWRHRPGRGESLPFTGWAGFEAETYFPQVGINLFVLRAGRADLDVRSPLENSGIGSGPRPGPSVRGSSPVDSEG